MEEERNENNQVQSKSSHINFTPHSTDIDVDRLIEEELEKDGIRIDENEKNQENQGNQEPNHIGQDDTPTSSSIEARPYQEQKQGTDQRPEQEEQDPEREPGQFDQESSVSVSQLFEISDDYFPSSESERPDSSLASTRKSSEISKDAMIKLVVVVFCLSSGISLLATIIEVYSKQPIIIPAKNPQPFISNDSSSFIDDFYIGNANAAKLETFRFLNKVDLVITMYYAPWSTESREFKHKFEIVAKAFKPYSEEMKFIAINCWAVNGECRRSFKLYTHPVIVAYIKAAGTSHAAVYTGTYSIDQFYNWILNVRYPYYFLSSLEQLQEWQKEHRFIAVGYFPFENSLLHNGFNKFLAAAFKLKNGDPNFESNTFAIVTSKELALSLGIQLPADVFVYSGKGYLNRLSMLTPGMSIEDIAQWFDDQRTKFIVRSKLHWVQIDQLNLLMSTRLADFLNASSALILVTRYEPIYRNQDDALLMKKISDEYRDCEDILMKKEGEKIEYKIGVTERLESDKEKCDKIGKADLNILTCCRSIAHAVLWDEACMSSTKYYWTDQEVFYLLKKTLFKRKIQKIPDDKEERSRRSHWADAYIPKTECCGEYTKGKAQTLVEKCCQFYEYIFQRPLSKGQQRLETRWLIDQEKSWMSDCIRSKLFVYMRYGVDLDAIPQYTSAETVEQSIRGLSCKLSNSTDSLRFLALDAVQHLSIINRWGLSKKKLPFIVVANVKNEFFSVMEQDFEPQNIRQFIIDYHDEGLSNQKLCESQFVSKFPSKRDDTSEITLFNETRFREMVHQNNLTHESVVLFSGGRSHSATMSIMHVYRLVARYFSKVNPNLFRFYIIDTSVNDLPYNFNFERLPAIVMFSKSPEFSWIFPDTLPITSPNLISFIISQSCFETRVRILVAQCKSNECVQR
ncbi:hypothetical protein WR25_21942 [Diploscapter pachys]|uniref:Thioredoxin domain-containing protein n=1 Tax=Diploscapter pachys TaxID=2018661 RepID=A0A2A2K566_9BILA|nr:hypothetical protein WR25_21942 [Diploscapter pachys]